MNKLVIPSIVAGSGAGGKKLDQRIIIKDTVIPEASEKHLGKMYCYAGETNFTYTHGYIYECVADSTYDPIIGFEPSKIGFDYTQGDLLSFWRDSTPNFNSIVGGIFEYDVEGNIWLISAVDKDGNTILPHSWDDASALKLYTEDLEDAGFRMLYPMYDYTDGEKIEFYIDFHEQRSNYHWVRINVQPSSADELALLSITTAPSGSFAVNSKYYNSTEKKIYTATLPNSWTNAIIEDPSFNAIYIYNSTAYVWDGNSLELFELEEYQRKLVSGQNIKTINSNSILGSGNLNIDTLPSQTGNTGKSLTTNGTDASWQNVEEIKEQNANELIKVWYGTQNEYDAISEYDDNTDYKIVDDSSVNSTLLATQQEFNSGAQNKAATPYQVLNAVTGKLPHLYYYNSSNWTISQDNLTLTIEDTTGAYLVKVYRNGILAEPSVGSTVADYTVNGASLTMTTVLGPTDKIAVEIIK